jgi:hypothetical protein
MRGQRRTTIGLRLVTQGYIVAMLKTRSEGVAMTGRSLPLLLALAVLVLASTCVRPAAAQIRGTFVFTGNINCLETENGFNSSFEPLSAPSFLASSSTIGYGTFNRNGTGTVLGRGTSTYAPVPPGSFTPDSSSAAEYEYHGSFTYTVASDGMITMTLVPGSDLQTYTSGPRTGQTATQDVLTEYGYLSPDGKTLEIATGATYVETKTFSNGDVRQYICHGAGTAVLQ